MEELKHTVLVSNVQDVMHQLCWQNDGMMGWAVDFISCSVLSFSLGCETPTLSECSHNFVFVLDRHTPACVVIRCLQYYIAERWSACMGWSGPDVHARHTSNVDTDTCKNEELFQMINLGTFNVYRQNEGKSVPSTWKMKTLTSAIPNHYISCCYKFKSASWFCPKCIQTSALCCTCKHWPMFKQNLPEHGIKHRTEHSTLCAYLWGGGLCPISVGWM